MQNTTQAEPDWISAPPAIVYRDLIMFAGGRCAVPGTMSLDGVPLGTTLLSVWFFSGLNDLVVQSVREVGDTWKAVGRPSLRFPTVSGRFLQAQVNPGAPLELACEGSCCGLSENFLDRPPNDTWPSTQTIIRFRLRAAYTEAGLTLAIDGEMARLPQPRDPNTGQPPPPQSFALSGVLPWHALPYVFEMTPPFYEEIRKKVAAS